MKFLAKFKVLLLILSIPVMGQEIDDPLQDYSHVFLATRLKDDGLYVCRIKNSGPLLLNDAEIVKYIKNIISKRKGEDASKNWVLLVKFDPTQQAPNSKFRLDLLPVKTASGFQWMKGLQSISCVNLEPTENK
jgi:hypothetical protein